jgi:hypothetical protein
MSGDDRFLVTLARAFRKARLTAILIGNAGAVLHGAPVMTKRCAADP